MHVLIFDMNAILTETVPSPDTVRETWILIFHKDENSNNIFNRKFLNDNHNRYINLSPAETMPKYFVVDIFLQNF